jgi:hypothetical protein
MRFWVFVFIVAMVGCHRRPEIEEEVPTSCPPIQYASPAPAVSPASPTEIEVYKTTIQVKDYLLAKCMEQRSQALKDLENAQKDADTYRQQYYDDRSNFHCEE